MWFLPLAWPAWTPRPVRRRGHRGLQERQAVPVRCFEAAGQLRAAEALRADRTLTGGRHAGDGVRGARPACEPFPQAGDVVRGQAVEQGEPVVAQAVEPLA